MYFEAVFSFYLLLYHFVGHSLFGLVTFRSFSDIIKRNFSLTFAKLNFYVDMSVWLLVGKQYYRLNMFRHLNIVYHFLKCSWRVREKYISGHFLYRGTYRKRNFQLFQQHIITFFVIL